MKDRTKKTAARVCSVLVAATLISGVALIDNGSARGLLPSASRANGMTLTDVSDRYSTAGIRGQYLNGNAVFANASVKNEERWVIVDLGGTPLIEAYDKSSKAATFSEYANTVAAQNLKAQIERSNIAFLSRLSASGVKFEYKYSYSTLNTGVAIKIKNSDVATVKAMGGVKEVYSSEAYAVPTVAVTNNANAYTTGIYNTTGIKQQGQGMVVSILDTGLDYTHKAFETQPASPSMTESTVKEALPKLEVAKRDSSIAVDDVYITSKIPFAYDYADDDTDVYPAYSTHGTHVAGIVAGKDDSKTVNTETNEKFIGVAPEAQLVICKVFSDDLESKAIGGANSVDILAAIADSVTLGVDVINMSLGQTAGFSEEGYATAGVLADVYERVEKAGVSLVCAASNDFSSAFGGTYGTNLTSNPDSGTVGSPSTFDGALSVAAINGQESNYFAINGNEDNVAFLTESADANGNKYNFLDGLYEKTGTAKTEDLTLNYVVVGGVGSNSNYTQTIKNALKSAPTIAVVKRGDISFAEKVQYAMSAGAVGCIIYNNVSGNISMSLGEVNNPIPTCSVSMDAGKLLVDGATGIRGTVTFSYKWSAGPFMSDFSSWGPTPDLKLKPEITAHGGEITSSVPGGYAVMSGTSMATPNMSGAIALLRQYVKETYHLEGKELSDRVNQLLMSTATMALGEEGNPYSPRKQGAGLASILKAIDTNAYITAKNDYLGANSTKDPKPKIELGDDPKKTGVYEFEFTVNNTSANAITYKPEVYVMTETLSTDLKTVAEKAYMLTENCNITVPQSVTVPAKGNATVKVKIELKQTARDYLDKTFQNGMFVEGFVRLNAEGEEVSLGIPYLAFYGDWMKAPMFDYSTYEVEESAADMSVEEEDKIKATVNPSRPYGLYNDEQFIITLGSYLYDMGETYTKILPSEEHAAISAYDYKGRRTVYELYSLNAGLLRSAKEMEVVISDAATGEVVYSYVEENVRKSYSAGGANRGTNIALRIDPFSWDLNNNKTYVATFNGKLDYDNGTGSTERDSYSFSFTIDTEAPRVLDTRLRFEPYEENHVTKYRIYLDADVYDNQYAMSLLPCYLDDNSLDDDGEPMLMLLSQFPIPVYSQKGGVTTVTYEVTDCYKDYLLTGNFYLCVQDYALNESVYAVDYAEATQYPSELTLATDDKLTDTFSQGAYPVYNLSLDRYEAYTVSATSGLPADTAIAALGFLSSNENLVTCKNNEIFALEAGTGTVLVKGSNDKTVAQINVTVREGSLSKPVMERITLSPMTTGTSYLTPLNGEITLKPNNTRQIQTNIEPWYTGLLHKPEFTFESSDDTVVTVDGNGKITTLKKGYAYVYIRVKDNNLVPTYILKVNVEDELDIINNVLYHYYGGAECIIPDNKNILSIDEEAFKNNKLVELVVLPISVTSLPENCFLGCENLKKVVIPAECTVINAKAFAGCTSLEEIVLVEAEDKITKKPYPGTLTVGRSAFEGCTSLTTISNQTRITAAYDNAFAGCTSLTEIDISGLRMGGDHIFDGCTKLETVTMSELTHIGKYMFNDCALLGDIEYYANVVPDYAFAGCTNLNSFTAKKEIQYFGSHAFDGCTKLTVTISSGADVSFGAAVFANGASYDNQSAEIQVTDGMLVRGDTLLMAYAASGAVTLPAGVTKIGAYAFAESNITSIDLTGIEVIPEGAFKDCAALTSVTGMSSVTEIGAYAFAGCEKLTGALTLPNVKTIGDYAFYLAPVRGLSAENLQRVGDYAFYGHNIQPDVSLLKLTSIGSFAFAKNPDKNAGNSFYSVELGAVTEMGAYVFADCPLITVKFKEGTTVIGAFAFVSAKVTVESILVEGVISSANRTLESVTVPASVETIGDFAFLYAENLGSEEIDLSGAKDIGMGAFWYCGKVTALDLSGAVIIGGYAFAESGIAEANLQNAISVGVNAFAGSKLMSLSMPKIKHIGGYAFAGTALASVEIPASLSLTYEDEWFEFDDFGEAKLRSGRYFYAYGMSAFAATRTLKTFTVEAGSESFFTDDFGVLYGIISGTKEKGTYVLLQFPAGKEMWEYDNKYTVLENTVRIGDGAFYGIANLKEVRLPSTVKEIGSLAFYDTNIERYIFEGTQAPVLEAAYGLPYDYEDEDFLAAIDYFGIYYANFLYYVGLPVLSGGQADFGLTLVYPENATGYDNLIWSGFFSTKIPMEAAKKPSGLSAGAIAGICVGGAAVLAAAAVGAALFLRKRH